MMSDKEIHLLSGHMTSGKSFYFIYFRGLPEYKGPGVMVADKDALYMNHFGARVERLSTDDDQGYLLKIFKTMTQQERFYTDELLRVDIERALFTGAAHTVLLDVVMRTRKIHQNPFVAMVKKVEKMLLLVEKDKTRAQGLPEPNTGPRVNLRVVLLYCDFEAILRRLAERWPHLPTDKLPAPFIESMGGFEVPNAYEFLAIDTSDSRSVAQERNKSLIKSYFSGKGPDNSTLKKRAEEAKRSIAATKRRIRKFL